MAEPTDRPSGLPDIVRNSDRPIIIYQGQPGVLDAPTSSALGLLSWLALLTVCLGAIVFSVWQVWNPGYDEKQFSPIYAEGRPLGLAKQVEERRQINQRADGLNAYLDSLRAQRYSGARGAATHPLINDRDGIDDLRARWDTMCNNIRARIYDRRFGALDAREDELRRQRMAARDPAERARLDDETASLRRERADLTDRRRTDADPELRCVAPAQAPLCSDADNSPWCHPEIDRPRDFVDKVR